MRERRLPDPAQAEEFVERTGCDSLAVAIGTSHGAYKFSGNQRLRLDTLAEINRRLAGFPLVLHGGSVVPADEVKRIRAAGGRFDDSASGVPDSDLAHKDGSISNARTDAGILYTPSGPILLCVLTSENADRRWVRDNAGNLLCARIARAVYDHYAEKTPAAKK